MVLEIICGEHEINEIAARESISPNLLRNWKSEFLEKATLVFDQKRDQRLKDELEEKKEAAIETEVELSIKKKAELLSVSRKCIYNVPKEPDQEEIDAKHKIDELHTEHPAWGSRQLSR